MTPWRTEDQYYKHFGENLGIIWVTSCFRVFKIFYVSVTEGDKRTGIVPLWLFLLVLQVARQFETLRYKPEGRGFDSRCCDWTLFIDIILPAAQRPWRSTQTLTEMSTKILFWG